MQAHEARRGNVVPVRHGHRKDEFAGMRGTIQERWGNSEHAAVEVLLEDGNSELFWLADLPEVDERITVYSLGLLPVEHENIDGQDGIWLPFGYYLERDADLLILRRSDNSLVAAFSAEGVDLFEVELAVWADAD